LPVKLTGTRKRRICNAAKTQIAVAAHVAVVNVRLDTKNHIVAKLIVVPGVDAAEKPAWIKRYRNRTWSRPAIADLCNGYVYLNRQPIIVVDEGPEGRVFVQLIKFMPIVGVAIQLSSTT
jgi:hypothetical protein